MTKQNYAGSGGIQKESEASRIYNPQRREFRGLFSEEFESLHVRARGGSSRGRQYAAVG